MPVIWRSQVVVTIEGMQNEAVFPGDFSRELPNTNAGDVLEAIVTELEVLTSEAAIAIGTDLITLHGALLAYELGGVADAVPSVGFGMSGRRLLERRVCRAARQLIGAHQPDVALQRAGELIEELIHLIDPELRILAA